MKNPLLAQQPVAHVVFKWGPNEQPHMIVVRLSRQRKANEKALPNSTLCAGAADAPRWPPATASREQKRYLSKISEPLCEVITSVSPRTSSLNLSGKPDKAGLPVKEPVAIT